MKDVALAAALTALASWTSSFDLCAQGKPTNTYDIQADGGYSAGSVSDLWKLSGVVAEIHLAAPRLDEGALRTKGLPALTYDGRIRTLFKADQFVTAPDSPIAVSRVGGRIDRGDHFADYVDSSFARFVPEKTYMLFLRRDATGRYWPATGTADSAYLVDGDKLRALGRTSLTATVTRMSRGALVEALLRASGK